MATMARETWTDERMDDLAKRVDDGFDKVDRQFERVDRRFEQVDKRFDEARAETNELRRELVAAVERGRAETKALGDELNRRFDGLQRILIVTLFGAAFTLIAALLTPQLS